MPYSVWALRVDWEALRVDWEALRVDSGAPGLLSVSASACPCTNACAHMRAGWTWAACWASARSAWTVGWRRTPTSWWALGHVHRGRHAADLGRAAHSRTAHARSRSFCAQKTCQSCGWLCLDKVKAAVLAAVVDAVQQARRAALDFDDQQQMGILGVWAARRSCPQEQCAFWCWCMAVEIHGSYGPCGPRYPEHAKALRVGRSTAELGSYGL